MQYMIYGYMRVSTQERDESYGKSQTFDRQELILKEFGVQEENIFRERISGGVATKKREEWERLMETAKAGDMIIVSEMSRLARSLQDLIETVNMLIKKNIGINFLKEKIVVGNNGMDAMNKLMFNMFGAFAEFEKNIISDRTKQGLQAKKAMGVKLGREKVLTDEQYKNVYDLRELGKSFDEIAKETGISKGQCCKIYHHVKEKSEVIE